VLRAGRSEGEPSGWAGCAITLLQAASLREGGAVLPTRTMVNVSENCWRLRPPREAAAHHRGEGQVSDLPVMVSGYAEGRKRGGGAQVRRWGGGVFLGWPGPPQPSRRVGLWGNPVSLSPGSRAAPRKPSRGRRYGETGFPHSPLRELMFTSGPMRGAHTARCTRPGSAGVPPAARLRGQSDGPLPSPPPPGEEVRLLPLRGEAGRGAARGERWSPQPSMRLRRTPTG